MSLFLQDLRYAVRVLSRKPGFTFVALLTLALAIGANTAIFSIVNAMLLRPLPYPESERIVQLMRGFPQGTGSSLSVPKFVFWRDQSSVFSSISAYDTLGSGFNLTGDGAPERLTGSRVSQQFFQVFRAHPSHGRDFLPEEDQPNGPRVVILSEGLWKRRFGGDPSLLGRAIRLNDEPYTVIGIMPASFRYPTTAELWTPLGIDRASREKANYLEISARLRDGVTMEKAQAEMDILSQQYDKAWTDEMADGEVMRLISLQERLYGNLRPALLIMLGTVGLVLLIACVNLANLQLVRASARGREVAIRTALGASSRRIVAQLLTESLVLSLAGGLLGLLLGAAAIKPLLALSPATQEARISGAALPDIGIDANVLLFAFGVSLLSGVLFGLVPALQAARPNLNDPLKEDSARSTGSRKGRIARVGLVVVEVAVALLVVTGAALLARSFGGMIATDPGFRPEGVTTLKLSLPEAKYGKPVALDQLSRQMAQRLESIPGVTAATVASSVPMEMGPDLPFTIEGKYAGGEEGVGEAQVRASSSGYFETLGIRLSRGRFLVDQDNVGGELVAVINEAAARRFWPDGDALGSQIRLGMPFVQELADPLPRRVVGIVKDVREVGLDRNAPPIVYIPMGQLNPNLTALLVRMLPITVAVRSEGSASGLLKGMQQEIWAVDPQLPITGVASMEQIVSRSLGSHRFNLVLMATLAFLALVLAGVGIYGVLSYLVSQRTREIGVRMALGATSGRVLMMVIRQGLVAVGIGVVIGLGLVIAGTQVLASLLVGVSTRDPLTFVVAAAVLTSVALLASSIPARRASLLDPLRALRKD